MIHYRQFSPLDVGKPADAMITAHGVTMLDDDRVIAVGGLVRVGTKWWTFSEIKPEARVAIRLHRLVLAGLKNAEAEGITPIYGYCDETKPRARDWIERIGFRPIRAEERDDEVDVVERWCHSQAWIREMAGGH